MIVCSASTPPGTLLRLSLALSVCMMIPSLSYGADSDSAFLACAAFADRGQRIACLEDTLEAALAARGTAPQAATAPAAPSPATAATTAATPASTATLSIDSTPAAPTDEPSLLDRVRSFGKRVDVSTDDSGNERLHDSITALEKRNELWVVTLSSGQVWRQEVARALNLRVGDDIEIYQEGIGNGYRLSTPRLSGFIRVERVR